MSGVTVTDRVHTVVAVLVPHLSGGQQVGLEEVGGHRLQVLVERGTLQVRPKTFPAQSRAWSAGLLQGLSNTHLSDTSP